VKEIAWRTAHWAERTLVLADGTAIPADDFFTYIWLKLLPKLIGSKEPSVQLFKRAARDKAIEFARLVENYPLGLAEFDQRADPYDRPQVRREVFNEDTMGATSLTDPEFWQRMAEAFDQLTVRQREVVICLYVGLTLREVASVLKISPMTAQREKVAAEHTLRAAFGLVSTTSTTRRAS
jgi:RNA polymerase sigma factor (sigma-70 family)